MSTCRLNIAELRLIIGLSRHISWILCRMLFDGIQQRPLLLTKVGRHLIINISEELRKPVFWHPLGHLNGLQELHRNELTVSVGHVWKNKCITEIQIHLSATPILHYLLPHIVPEFRLLSVAPPSIPLNPFSVPGDGIPRCSPMLHLISRPVLGWIVGCRVMADSVGHRLEVFYSVKYSQQMVYSEILLFCTSIKIGLPSVIAISRAVWTALYTARVSLPSTLILRIP